MRRTFRNIAAGAFVALCLLGNRIAIASDWVSMGGNVQFVTTPVCALVLINGQTQFSCDGTGRYDMQVPVDENGLITVMAFADGFAPFNQIVTPGHASEYAINMLLDQQSPIFQVETAFEPSATEGRFIVSGAINSGVIPVCALVLANGQTMFSCNESSGQFSLDVPIDQDGIITLMVFATGFKPYKLTTQVVRDTDGDGIRDYLDYDDDNDGIFDTDDSCPSNPILDCKQITDTITVDGKVWAQLKLFTNLTWNHINTVCPSGVCTGVLNGYDISGWKWANVDEVNALFNSYIGSDALGPGPDEYRDADDWALDFFVSGWKPTEIDLGYGIYGLTSGGIDAFGHVPWAFMRSGVPSPPHFSWAMTGAAQYIYPNDACSSCGGWFFRSAIP